MIDRIFVNRASTSAEKVPSGVQIMQFQLLVKTQGNTVLTQSGVEIFQDPANPDSYSAPNTSITVRAKDGSSESGNTGGGASGGGIGSNTETITNPDGSTTEIEEKPDGTVVETTTGKDGSTTRTETRPDGSSKTEIKDANGSTGTTETDKTGKTEAEVNVSDKAISDAKNTGDAVKVPTEVKAEVDSELAPVVKIVLPKDTGEVKIKVPVSNVNTGTVAIIVKEDGTEEIIKNTVPSEDGIQFSVSGDVTIKVVDNSIDFIDTRNHWSREEVNFVAARGMFNGIGNNLFGVSLPMTRGMVCTVLARLAGENTNGGVNWYDKGVAWAVKNGISDGTNPEGEITREQLAAMLYRFSGAPRVDGELSFADAHEISDYARNAMLWAVQNGILNGIGDNLVAPKNTAERAQVAAMMARFLKNVG